MAGTGTQGPLFNCLPEGAKISLIDRAKFDFIIKSTYFQILNWHFIKDSKQRFDSSMKNCNHAYCGVFTWLT